jgi:PST family polysaccharide transporter
MFDKTIIKNISSLFSIQVASYIIPLITLPYLVSTLGVEGFGYLGFSLAITQYAILIINYGFDLSATSAIAKCRNNISKVSEIFWYVLSIRLLSFSLTFIMIIIACRNRIDNSNLHKEIIKISDMIYIGVYDEY